LIAEFPSAVDAVMVARKLAVLFKNGHAAALQGH
jgi:hypothetical protein